MIIMNKINTLWKLPSYLHKKYKKTLLCYYHDFITAFRMALTTYLYNLEIDTLSKLVQIIIYQMEFVTT